MSVYYIKASVGYGDVTIALDATTDIVEGFSAELPSFKLETGAEGSDHHTLKAPVISFKGVLTDIKSLSSGFRIDGETQTQDGLTRQDGSIQWKSVKDNKEALLDLWKNHRPLSIFTDQSIYQDCYITSLGFSQNTRHGVIGGKSSLEVSITVKQPVRGTRAQIVAERDLSVTKAYQTKARERGVKRTSENYDNVLKDISDYYEEVTETVSTPLTPESDEVFQEALQESIDKGNISEGEAIFYERMRERQAFFRSFK